MAIYTVYGDRRSGNCYKAALILSLTGRPFVWRDVDVLSGATRTPDFLAINPNGRVPVMLLPDGRVLTESNAMLLHLGEGTPFVPGDAYTRALVYQWLFFEQYSHEPAIAVARFLRHFDHGRTVEADQLQTLEEKGYAALAVMENTLSDQSFIAGEHYSVADIALFAYTHVAHEGGFNLAAFPGITRWLQDVRACPGHADMADLDYPREN